MDIKRVLFGHVKDQVNEALLHQARRNLRVHLSDRPTGSYVLVDVPTQKESHKTYKQDGTPVGNSDPTRDIR